MNSEQHLKSNLFSNLIELVAQSCHTLQKWFPEGKKIQSTAEDLFLDLSLIYVKRFSIQTGINLDIWLKLA